MIRHLLVTNDFPPKIGGIQSYLWELWRRLPAAATTVLTSPYPGATAFDAEQAFRIERTKEPVLLPHPGLVARVRRLAAEVGAQAVVLDPALPLGFIGPSLGLPYAAVLHGAEVTVPARLPGSRQLLGRVLGGASLLISAGGYPEGEARRAVKDLPPVVQVPPGVDTGRFLPLEGSEKGAARARLGLPVAGPLVVSVSRLVPRKGMDVLIEAAALLARSGWRDLHVVIAGHGRDRSRLERLISSQRAPVRLVGRVPGVDLPALYASADVFALCCRSRWAGLEQEGFGIVFLEAAAAGVPSVAGDSGGSAEAVVDGETGFVIDEPRDPQALATALEKVLANPDLGSRQGDAARRRAVEQFSYDGLAGRLAGALDGMIAGP